MIMNIIQPDSGRIERAAMFADKDGATSVLLSLDPSGSVFVVFRKGDGPLDPVVTVTRDGKPTPSPGPDFRLEAGDVLVLVGTHKQLDAAKAALEASQDAPPLV